MRGLVKGTLIEIFPLKNEIEFLVNGGAKGIWLSNSLERYKFEIALLYTEMDNTLKEEK